ncbi:ricin-type beta-trefoil lectin domain protein [Allorhizocola rhizosphaerae]|uniref:ricin-type beta-trefoil lectin domain protein n=1 Tax=Allorhizocola rhizosphaerae TaxID=1872709 RepID=UPI000E3EC7FF|nr:ricin-type beta-trefoil lectin domain protein [Allorhizocola rhizosphaerae]
MSTLRHRRIRLAASAVFALALLASSAVSVSAPATAAPTATVDGHDHSHDHAAVQGAPKEDPARGLVYRGLAISKTGPCAGGYQVMGIDFVMCTHGPDAPPPGSGLDVKRPVPLTAATADGPQLQAVCEGDGVSGKRVEVLYIHGSTNRYSQVVEQLRSLAEQVDTIYYESARETGGERRVRYVTETVNGACRPVVRDVQISDSALNANDWAPLLNAVRAAGYTRTDRKYLQFTESRVYCGIGGFAGDTSKSDNNRSNSGPEYARADAGCWSAGVAAHELGHTLGAVNNNAPNASGYAHCEDEWDVMCYKDHANTVIRTVCTDRAHDNRLDCGHDDYYHTNPPAGSYLAQYYNVADNHFLIRGPGGPTPTTFRLRNNASSTCLDDPNSNTANGTQMIIWTCHTNPNQVITQSGSALQILGKCLEANTGRVVLNACGTATSQQWQLRTDGTLFNVGSGQCVQPANGATANGTLLVLATCGTQTYQLWTKA